MSEYRLQPIKFDAIQYKGHNFNEIMEYTQGRARPAGRLTGIGTFTPPISLADQHTIIIKASTGDIVVRLGDYIIKLDENGDFMTCRQDVFDKIHDWVRE